MRTIVHISDLHFGTEDPPVAEALIPEIQKVSPAVVIVSGDLTQRARTDQFKAAAAYLQRIEFPKIVIPGNHDIPLYDVFTRFAAPLKRYKEIISDNMYPEFEDDEIYVIGINTARSFTWKKGRISLEQIAYMKDRLCKVDNKKFKIAVTHHPFVPPPEEESDDLVGRGDQAVDAISDCGIDLILAGHAHRSYTADVKTFYAKSTRAFIIAQAGTAISDRRRKEPNTFNVITVTPSNINIEVKKYDKGKFIESDRVTFSERNDQWSKSI